MDRTEPKQKANDRLGGKRGIALGSVGIAAIALTFGMFVGGGSSRANEHGHAAAHDEGHAHGDQHAPAHEEHAPAAREGHAAAHEEHASAHEKHGDGHKAEHATPRSESYFHKLFGTYSDAWDSVQDKVSQVHHAEIENERLRLENAHLRLQLEGLQFNCSAKDASAKTKSIEYKLDKETGSLVGRDLSSIAYRVPTNLVPGQLYTLGVSYFKGREDEKAAVIFSFLTGLDDNDVFKTPKNFLMTGIAWYRLDNFAAADRYLDKALKAPETEENLQTLAHARLWKALVAQHVGKHTQSQFWLTELIDHHPLSDEAGWVSSKSLHPKRSRAHREAQRGVASEE